MKMTKLFSVFLFIVLSTSSTTVFPQTEDACPEGYRVARNDNVGLYCASDRSPSEHCPGQTFVYTCGPRALKCCGINEDNPCMAGWYASRIPNAPDFGSGKKLCSPR